MIPAAGGRLLFALADVVDARAAVLAEVETLTCGKPLQEAEGDLVEVVRMLRYYGGLADKLDGRTVPLGADQHAFTVREPVGVTAQVIPWNYPLHTTVRGVAPALAAGCTVVVKPAPTTPLTALALAEAATEVGFPDGVLQVLAGGTDTGRRLVGDPRVRHVTFTGSIGAGTEVMRTVASAQASVVLELGGKSPIVVRHDADLAAAAEGITSAITLNAGQVCNAGSRLVVDHRVRDDLLADLVARFSALRVGHGLARPDVGAIATAPQCERVLAAIGGVRDAGADVLVGGEAVHVEGCGDGWYVAPTILDGLADTHPAVQEEVFGPVLVVQTVADDAQALAVANETRYGLAAGIYTRDLDAALRFVRDVEAGLVTVNDWWAGGIEMPFGGVGSSGFGREGGIEAIDGYTRTKGVAMRLGGGSS